MLFSRRRGDLREVFFQAWRKHQEKTPLSGVEPQIVDIALQHPEYRSILEQADTYRERDYSPEAGTTNPFFHMAMHLTVVEQLSTDRPKGIQALYRQRLAQLSDPHAVQHEFMECLGEWLWRAHKGDKPPSEDDYLECLRQRAGIV